MSTWYETINNDAYFDPSQAVGTRVRFVHTECGNRRAALIVTRQLDCWVFHCHFCGTSGVRHLSGYSPTQVIELYDRLALPVHVINGTLQLPRDCTQELPRAAVKWLLKYQVLPEWRVQYRMMYSNYMERLIFPVFEDDDNTRLALWNARNFGTDGPKYITQRAPGTKTEFFTSEHNQACQEIVLTEDIISAIKVRHLTGVNSCAILSSVWRDGLFKKVRDKSQTFVWLDPDKYSESVRLSYRLNQFGCRAAAIISTQDPKAHSKEELCGYLEKARYVL